MKKASKAILGGLIGAVGATGGVQAGIPAVGLGFDSDFDLNAVCKPDGSGEFEANGCSYEVSWRCDGAIAQAALSDEPYGVYGVDAYGVCISGSFAGGEGLAASWAADVLLSPEARTDCEDTQYGFYGWFDEGPSGPPVGINGFTWTALNKLESKITTAAQGNGKKAPHPGRKGDDEDNLLTVEIELKLKECVVD